MSDHVPLQWPAAQVLAEWIDYNGHMNVAYYVLAFDRATDGLLDHLGMDAAYRARTGHSNYVLEAHVTYERELRAGDHIRVTTQLLDHDAKRLHFFHQMYHAEAGVLAATNELISLHVDAGQARAKAFPEDVRARIGALMRGHGRLERPTRAGRVIGIRRGS